MPFQKGHPPYSSYRFPKGMIPWNKGKKFPPMSEEDKKHHSDGAKKAGVGKWMSGRTSPNKGKNFPNLRGINNGEWKGDAVGYRALHHWVQRWLGKPKKCEYCGKKQTSTGKMIHWANKSGKYLRDVKDWLSLCAKCHKCYDKSMKGGH